MGRLADAEAAGTPRPRRPRLRWVTRNEAVDDQADAGRSARRVWKPPPGDPQLYSRIKEHVEG